MPENSEQSSLEIYLKQISAISLITVEEEIDLAKKSPRVIKKPERR